MFNTRLLELFKTFDAADWKSFRAFLQAKVRHKSEILSLFNYIHRSRANLASEKMAIDNAHRTLYPEISKKSFQNLISRLNQQVLDYITFAAFQRESFEYQLYRLRALNKRGIHGLADKFARQLSAQLSNDDHLDIWKHLYRMRLRHFHYFSDNPIKYSEGSEMILDSHVHLKNFCQDMTSYYKTESKNMDNITGGGWSDVVSYFIDQDKTASGDKQSKVLQSLDDLITIESKPSFYFLKETLLSEAHVGTTEMDTVLLVHLLNFGTDRIREGDAGFHDQILELYTFGVEKGILLDHGKISVQRFINIMSIGASLKRLDWTDNFVNKYGHLLLKSLQKDTVRLCRARILFEREEYDPSLEILNQLKPRNMVVRRQARSLSLICQYTVFYDDKEFLLNCLRNYNDFLRRNKNRMSPKTFLFSVNFSFFLRSIIKEKNLSETLVRLENTRDVDRRSWLLNILKDKLTMAR